MVVPVPDSKTQAYVVAETMRRHREAMQLRTEAETGWRQALNWFEEQLLGPTAQ